MAGATEQQTVETPTAASTSPVRPSDARSEPGALSAAEEVLAHRAMFPSLTPGAAANGSMPLGFLLDVTVTLTAELGRTTLTLGEVLRLGSGSVVPLDRLVAEPVDLTARGVLLARGEVVVVDDRFAVRIKEIVQARQAPAEGA